jgi:hypothetical protein
MSFNPLQTLGERPQQRLPISESRSEDFIEIHHLVPRIDGFEAPRTRLRCALFQLPQYDSPDEGSS